MTLFKVALVCLASLELAKAQGCSNTCPPVNYGTPVPALCEGDMADTFADTQKVYDVCHGGAKTGSSSISSFSIDSLKGRVVVFANYYTGCNAGRRESGVFAHLAQRFFEAYGEENIVFVQSVKGGGTCQQWASRFQNDALSLYPGTDIVPREMPLSVDDVNYEIRDDLFTTPFGHPSYVVLDPTGKVRHKFIGPCCGYEDFFACTADIALGLDAQLTEYLETILAEFGMAPMGTDPSMGQQPGDGAGEDLECTASEWSEWSPCSVRCGETPGVQFRTRDVQGSDCATTVAPVETRSCQANAACIDGPNSCIPEVGGNWALEKIVSGLNGPRDVDFHPTPGLHLGSLSEGRTFYPNEGQEAWIVNGGNHSVSIVASLGTDKQTTISRRDRGYYHYMINGTALAFNKVANSGRTPDRDSFNYWAICNDNTNTYLDTKESNFFMGPTLYDSRPQNRNVVNRLGGDCRPEEPCYFLHSDMLHESPACIGIAHDPEINTAYGTVYWAFDATGNRETGQLVRFDFQQPHGPGSMDHSVAAVRRYVEVELERGPAGVHAGMVVHPTKRQVYIATPGANKILVVEADSGNFARTAREEYPIYSNRLPSFEYSIWECVEQDVFAEGIDTPSGIALSDDGEHLFVAERGTGNILVFEVETKALLFTIPTEFNSIGGMTFSPATASEPAMLYFVDEDTNGLYRIKPEATCMSPVRSRTNAAFLNAVSVAEETVEGFSLTRDYQCQVDVIVPDSAFFDQVHEDTGYADENPDVQSNMTGMDAAAALLADRTDCGFDSELNFDALLLGGYFCHVCLPELELLCDRGGICSNVQWDGYTCDNEFMVAQNDQGVVEMMHANGSVVDPALIALYKGVTYRFTVMDDMSICASTGAETSLTCANRGPLLVSLTDEGAEKVSLTLEGQSVPQFEFPIEIRSASPSVGCVFGLVTAFFIALGTAL